MPSYRGCTSISVDLAAHLGPVYVQGAVGRYSLLKGALHFSQLSLFAPSWNGLNEAEGRNVLLVKGEHQQDEAQPFLLANPGSSEIKISRSLAWRAQTGIVC